MKKAPETKDQQAIEAAKEKRRSYARAYYAAHKDKLKDAVRRCRAKKAAAKHAIAPSKKAAKPTPAQKQLAKLQKQLAKAQAKLAAAKDAVAAIKAQVKEAKVKKA